MSAGSKEDHTSIREFITDCSKSLYDSTNFPTAHNEYAVVLCVLSQYEKKLIYQDKESFLAETNVFPSTQEGITVLRLAPRREALTWCEHANGLTSSATPGNHTRKKQDVDNNKSSGESTNQHHTDTELSLNCKRVSFNLKPLLN